jgi:predicted methyltransferase
MRASTSIALALVMFATPLAAKTVPAAPVSIATAVADPGRSADNVKLDEGRKPAQVLSYLGLRSGMHVLDLFGANAYWAEISSAVVGPNGHVTVWNPSQFYSDKRKQAFEAFMATHPNVSIVTSPFEAADLPKNYADWVILNDNYHDTYWQNEKLKIPHMDPNAFLKAVYAAMKPGAVIGVIDHVAATSFATRLTTTTPKSTTRRSRARPTASSSSSRSRVEREAAGGTGGVERSRGRVPRLLGARRPGPWAGPRCIHWSLARERSLGRIGRCRLRRPLVAQCAQDDRDTFGHRAARGRDRQEP